MTTDQRLELIDRKLDYLLEELAKGYVPRLVKVEQDLNELQRERLRAAPTEPAPPPAG